MLYALDGGPSLSVGFESEDPDASAEATVTGRTYLG